MSRRRTEGLSRLIGRRRWREEEARVVVSAWRRSGKSMSVFAREHALGLQRLSRWVGRLGDESKARVRFHPIRLMGGVSGTPGTIEVVLVDGRRVRMTEGFAAEELERVLRVLEGRV